MVAIHSLYDRPACHRPHAIPNASHSVTSKQKKWLCFTGGILLSGLITLLIYVFWWYPKYGFDYDEIQVVVVDPQSKPVVGAAIQLQYGVIVPFPMPDDRVRAKTDARGIAHVRVARNLDCEFLIVSSKLPQYSPTDGYGDAVVEFTQVELSSADKGTFKISLQYLNAQPLPDSQASISFQKNGRFYRR
jgi:hypothetical protein